VKKTFQWLVGFSVRERHTGFSSWVAENNMLTTTGVISIWMAIMWGDMPASAESPEGSCPRVYVHGSECLNLGIDADLGTCGDRLVRIGKIRCGAGVATAVVIGKKKRFRIRLEQSAGTAWGDARWNLVSVDPEPGRRAARALAKESTDRHAGMAP
jgi:hypothetical protein